MFPLCFQQNEILFLHLSGFQFNFFKYQFLCLLPLWPKWLPKAVKWKGGCKIYKHCDKFNESVVYNCSYRYVVDICWVYWLKITKIKAEDAKIDMSFIKDTGREWPHCFITWTVLFKGHWEKRWTKMAIMQVRILILYLCLCSCLRVASFSSVMSCCLWKIITKKG